MILLMQIAAFICSFAGAFFAAQGEFVSSTITLGGAVAFLWVKDVIDYYSSKRKTYISG